MSVERDDDDADDARETSLETLRAIRDGVRAALGVPLDGELDDYAETFAALEAVEGGDEGDDDARARVVSDFDLVTAVREACDDDGAPELAEMCDEAFDELVARAVASGEDVNAKSADGDDALHLAALYGRIGRVRSLLARGADAMGRDDGGGSALHDASASGNVEIVRALCEWADARGTLNELVSMTDDDGETPLHLAARGEHRDAVQYLLSRGAMKNVTSQAGETPFDACEDESVRALLAF